MKKHLSFIFLLLVFFCGNIPVFGQEKTATYRHFTGYVKDSDNNPVAGAKVCGWDKSGRPINGRIPCAISQKDGSFSLDIRKWEGDTYNIFVEDSEKGYPNPNSALYENFFRDKQIIDVDVTNEAKPIEIQLGLKAGKAILKIVDDESGKPVESGMVKMCRTDNPEICQSLSSAFPKGVVEILTPNSPVTLKIELWDGKEWKESFVMDENKTLIQTIQVELGQKKEIKIRIKR
jgi:hypothetical protein